MPRYYCDYCDTYLTHDSPSVRKQHNAGYKHKANVRIYYQQFEEQQTQSLIDQRIKEHLGNTAAFQQVGVAFNQHMLANANRPRHPMMPMPPPGSMPMPMGMRPPGMPRPMMPGQGFMPPPGVPQMMAPPGALPPPPQNGMLRPPGMAPLPGQGGNAPPPNYNGLPPPPPYHPNPGAPPTGSFNNPKPEAESPESNE